MNLNKWNESDEKTLSDQMMNYYNEKPFKLKVYNASIQLTRVNNNTFCSMLSIITYHVMSIYNPVKV